MDLGQGGRTEGGPPGGAEGQVGGRRPGQADARVGGVADVVIAFQPPGQGELEPPQALPAVGLPHQRQTHLGEDSGGLPGSLRRLGHRRSHGGQQGAGPGLEGLGPPLRPDRQPDLAARQGPERPLGHQVQAAGPAPVMGLRIAARDEVEDRRAVGAPVPEEVEIAVPRRREGGGGIVRQGSKGFVGEAIVDPVPAGQRSPLLGQGGVGVEAPVRRQLVFGGDGPADALRPPLLPRRPDVADEGIADEMGGRSGRRHEPGIGRRHRENARAPASGEAVVAAAVTEVRRQVEAITQRLRHPSIGAVAFDRRGQVRPEVEGLAIGPAGQEVRRGFGPSRSPGPDGVAGDIAADRRVEGQQVAGAAVEEPMVRPAVGAQVPVGGIGPVQAAEGVGLLVFERQIAGAVRPASSRQVRGDQVLGAAPGRRDPHPAFLAVEGAPHDDVDHAGDRVRAIESRGAVQQDVDPLHRRGRQGRDVGELGPEAGPRQPAAVDQDQGRGGPQPPEVEARSVDGVGAGPVGSRPLDQGRPRPGVVLRQPGEDLRHRGLSPPVERIAAQGDHRGDRRPGLTQKTAGHHDVVDLRGRKLRRRRPHTAQIEDARPRLPPIQTRAVQQALQGLVAGEAASQARRGPPLHQGALEEDLLVGRRREPVQDVPERPGRNLIGAHRLGCRRRRRHDHDAGRRARP